MKLEFFMDVSPQWWLKARDNFPFMLDYVYGKFERDYYPRIIDVGREKIDLDTNGLAIKKSVLECLKTGNFDYEFFPEEETLKESYEISDGIVHYLPRKTKMNSRILLKIKIS